MNTLPELCYIDRSDRGRIKLTGRDRQTFLQGMVTNDVVSLQPGQGCYAFMLDATGHVLSDLRILNAGEYLLLDCEPGMAPIVTETLEKYLIMERVKITDVSAELSQITVLGNATMKALQEGFGVVDTGQSADGANTTVTFRGADFLVAAIKLTPLPAFDFYVLPAYTTVVRWATGAPQELSAEMLDALRIEAGIPRFGTDIDSRVLAPETGQQRRAINYRKGCYIGQEIVARIDARGHTNRELAGFWLTDNTLPAFNTPIIVEGKDVGRITSTAIGPLTGRPIALGYIRHEHRAPGTPVQIGEQAAMVAELPFARIET